MKNAAAFSASFTDWKLIRTRSCVQLVFEVPIENADAAYQALGGMPDPSESRWFGIARLNPGAGAEQTLEANTTGTRRPPVAVSQEVPNSGFDSRDRGQTPKAFIEAKAERDSGWPEFGDRAAIDARREAEPSPGELPDVPASRPRQIGVCEAYGQPRCIGKCKEPKDCSAQPAKARKPVAAEKRLAQQAGICCADPVFQKFLGAKDEATATDYVRTLCGVSSRSDIKNDTEAGHEWNQLYSKFRLWLEHPELEPT